MKTQNRLQFYRIESQQSDRFSLVLVIVFTSLSMGLIPIAMLPLSMISVDFIPHEASLWKD